MKDIFIDAQIANTFACTTDENLNTLIDWLLNKNDVTPEHNAFLVVSNSLISEYLDGNKHCDNGRSIAGIFNKLLIDNRLNKKNNIEIRKFKEKYFTKKVWKSLDCKAGGSNDPDHIAIIYLSVRKMALTKDGPLYKDLKTIKLRDLENNIIVATSPEELDYK